MSVASGPGESPGESAAESEAVAATPANPDDINVWPTAAEEAAFLSEAQGRGEKIVPVAREVAEEMEDAAKPLPKLDELVAQIPGPVRETLEELFRAKFTAVRRVPKKALKTEA